MINCTSKALIWSFSYCFFSSLLSFCYFMRTSLSICYWSLSICLADCLSISMMVKLKVISFTTRLTPICQQVFNVITNWVKLKIQVMLKELKRQAASLWCCCLEHPGHVEIVERTTQDALVWSLHHVKMVETYTLYWCIIIDLDCPSINNITSNSKYLNLLELQQNSI